ncbi:MAG TPA: hypothetical protein VJ983_01305, partial [candidate division Zixibacteria bacterium]|nr:hypothetical protein [candidate division Zixibacteria bacterium]
MFYSNYRIRTKLYSAFGILIVLMLVISLKFFSTVKSTIAGYDAVLSFDVKRMMYMTDISAFMQKARRSEKDFLLARDTSDAAKGIVAVD